LADLPASRIDADLKVVGDLIVVTANNLTIGEWSRDDFTITTVPDGYQIEVEGEKLVFSTAAEGLLAAVAREAPVPRAVPAPVSTPEPDPPTPPPPMAPPRQRRRPPPPTPPPPIEKASIFPDPPSPQPSSVPSSPPGEPPFPVGGRGESPLPPSSVPSNTLHQLGLGSLIAGVAGTVMALVPPLTLLAVLASLAAVGSGLYIRRESILRRAKIEDAAVAGTVLGAVGLVVALIVAIS
jgi:hypothetical protein